MRMLKMRHDLPIHLEARLCQKLGYAVSRRQLNEFILFNQSQTTVAPIPTRQARSLAEIIEANKVKKAAEWVGPKQLTLSEIDDLTKRILNIVNSFADPTNHVGSIRARLYSMSQVCHRTADRNFVIEWMDEKFPSPIQAAKIIEPAAMPDKAVCKELEERCDRIVGFFQDPYNNIVQVRTRLSNMAKALKTGPERKYVQDYMDDNFPVEAK